MNNLKKLRNEKGIKQIELCEELKIAQATLSGWETGRYQIDEKNLFSLADFFDVTTDYLLGRTNDPTPPGLGQRAPSLEEAIMNNPDLSEESKRDMIHHLKLVKIRDNAKANNEYNEELMPKSS